MKAVVALLALLLSASAVEAQPIQVHLFTKPDDNGFVTPESKARQYILQKVTEKMLKEGRVKKEIQLTDDAPVTIEILAVETKGTGTSDTHTSALGVALKTPSLKETTQIRQTTVRAVLRFKDYEKELVSTHVDGELGDDQILFKEMVLQFVKDNKAKLK